jgi:hypothetical protein
MIYSRCDWELEHKSREEVEERNPHTIGSESEASFCLVSKKKVPCRSRGGRVKEPSHRLLAMRISALTLLGTRTLSVKTVQFLCSTSMESSSRPYSSGPVNKIKYSRFKCAVSSAVRTGTAVEEGSVERGCGVDEKWRTPEDRQIGRSESKVRYLL